VTTIGVALFKKQIDMVCKTWVALAFTEIFDNPPEARIVYDVPLTEIVFA
jgi:hypothetical protein